MERPASAVKELVENSLDADASHILISLTDGGKQRIEVSDDGCGMGREDAVLALQRHATSKIRSAEDLFAIQTLGFRGEALPSIASVSHFTLTTREQSEPVGIRIVAHGGDIETVEEWGGRSGTVIIVEELFYNTPARLKFLKSTATELSRTIDAIGHLAIANPGVAIRVLHNDQEVFSTPGSGDAPGCIASVWGRDIARKLIPLNRDAPEMTVSGYLCTPDTSRPGRSHELFFVNGRPIKSRILGHALEDAVRSLTPEGRFPIAAIFVQIAPDMVDVNVHPTKTEVKFIRDNEAHHAVSQAVKQALLSYGIVPTVPSQSFQGGIPAPARGSMYQHPLGQSAFSGKDFEALSRAAVELFRPIDTSDENKGPVQDIVNDFSISASVDPGVPRPFAEQLRGYRVLGQAQNTYIIALTDQGIAIIDQHTAHERVLYEYLTIKRAQQGQISQRLLTPITLALGAAEATMLKQKLEDFAMAGWEIESFGRDSFLVRAVPVYAAKREQEALLRDMVDELAHQSVARRLIVQREHVTITNACKMAVKAGDSLIMEEMTGLLERLADTENPYLCPHGRPIVITIPYSHIERQFKR